MRRQLARIHSGERRVAAEVLGGAAVVLAVFAKVYGLHGLALAGVSLLLAASMLLVIQAPGGSVPVGYALVIALAELQSASTFFPVLGLGLVATVPVLLVRSGQSETLRCLLRWAGAGCACGGAAALMRTAFPGASGDVTLIRVTVVGVVFLSVELLAARVLPSTKERAVRLRDSWPVDLSLLCASGLLAVGYRQGGVWMALVALLPIVLTRFAFDRYAAADEAYRQTIRALSIVPEVAGVAPMGHGERSAVYAVAIVKALGLGNEAIDRLGTAARLHHIGYVTLDDPEDAKLADNRDLLSRLGGDILRQTEFLSNVGDLVEGVHSGDPRVVTRETAVLRVATEFDLLVLEDPHRAPAALDRLTSDQSEAFGAAAVLALRWALDQDPGLIHSAIATGEPLTAAAAASEAAHG